jgi:adenosylhomocysteinase
MNTTMPQTKEQLKYKVKDMSLASWGRKEIELAEAEMPGLMALRERHGKDKPLKGARIAGCLHMTIQTAVLIETLQGARSRSELEQLQHLQYPGPCCCGDRQAGIPVYAWKGMNNEEFDWCIEQTIFAFEGGQPLNMILDDGGDLTNMVFDKFPELVKAASRASARRPPPACYA